jgi:trehalose-phosphatase
LLDYDGTLTPIAPTPAEAILERALREILISLSRKDKYTVGIISGRSLREVKRLLKIKGIYYAGNHGLEIEGSGIKFIHPDFLRFKPYIREINEALSAVTRGIKGIVLEDKAMTLSLHYRLVDKKWVSKIIRAFNAICMPYERKGKVKLTSGKKVLEVRPAIGWDKGKAVKKIKQLARFASESLICYIGDDKTDEDAFNVLRTKDISIFVGKATSSAARYYLKDTEEVAEFLERVNTLN